MIKWKPNASTEQDFDFTQKTNQVSTAYIDKICLTRDDKNLLVGSHKLVSVFNTETRNVTKKFKLNCLVSGINMIAGGKSALISEESGDLTIINLETMEMSPTHKNVINCQEL